MKRDHIYYSVSSDDSADCCFCLMINDQTNTYRLLRSVTQSHFYELLLTRFRWQKWLKRQFRRTVIDRFRRNVILGVFLAQGRGHLHWSMKTMAKASRNRPIKARGYTWCLFGPVHDLVPIRATEEAGQVVIRNSMTETWWNCGDGTSASEEA